MTFILKSQVWGSKNGGVSRLRSDAYNLEGCCATITPLPHWLGRKDSNLR